MTFQPDEAFARALDADDPLRRYRDLFLIPPDTLHDMEGFAPASSVPFVHFDLLYDPQRSHWEAHIPEHTTDLSRWSRPLHPPLNLAEIDGLRGSIRGYTNQQIGKVLVEMSHEFARGPSPLATKAAWPVQSTSTTRPNATRQATCAKSTSIAINSKTTPSVSITPSRQR